MTLNLDSIFDNDPKLNPYDAKIFYDYQYQYEPYIFIFYRDRLVEAFTAPEIMSMAHTLRKSRLSDTSDMMITRPPQRAIDRDLSQADFEKRSGKGEYLQQLLGIDT